MSSLFGLGKVLLGCHSYKPFVKVVLSERGDTSFSSILTFPFKLKSASEADFCLSFFELSFTHIKNAAYSLSCTTEGKSCKMTLLL